MLHAEGIVAGYGAIEALHGADFTVAPHEAVALVGPNGAGKSTLFGVISGLLRPWNGKVVFDGQDVTRWSAERRALAGLTLVPEGRRVFAGLTSEENLRLGAYRRARGRDVTGRMAEVFDLFPRLAERRRQRAGLLSGGEQQMLAIGRALMGRPRLLLLDEPSLGLAPLAVREVADALTQLVHTGVTIALVEQNAAVAFGVASRGYLLDRGQVVADGSVDDLRDDVRVHAAYLGEARG
ncbi:ABC transporter ATP-binding protein [Kibdelosporangium aridum]|uniref:Branched-chain amino acid transport system ATP-binding protein n=1 Tax=Kibdelosporangium aridum TaxID=2030 RepID=A0A1W2FXI4_KIBAR|nr:ABC transporter ATP-binding protein [Kibdelosporangium aridum]SMD26504.1 branched-chain amino acid transport system ATP-binding protein [Kibdelosporangium aridum]